jgi:Protein of unknown function (DUF3226)
MMSATDPVPHLYVEGKDDISVISNLLLRHGVDTERGKRHLCIKDLENDEAVLESMPEAIRANTDRPVGFVIDIDITAQMRWSAVSAKLREVGIQPPDACPPTGFVDKLADYPHRFGVWLMADCATDGGKLEHLVRSLVPEGDPLWPFSQHSVGEAARIVDEANAIIVETDAQWRRFRPVDQIKAEVYTWLAWQRVPGAAFGTAINAQILGADSYEAIGFLRWLRELYAFPQLVDI